MFFVITSSIVNSDTSSTRSTRNSHTRPSGLQGTTDYSPQTTAMRVIIAFFWFSVIIIEAAYTANLAAYLTLQQIDNRIKTVHDLAGQTQIKYGVKNNSNLMNFFMVRIGVVTCRV